MLFGSVGLQEELQSQGFEVKRITSLPVVRAPIQLLQKYLDLSVEGIVVGWDFQMTFIKQCYISFHIQNGIKLFGTNPDKFINLGGYKLPGNGAILAAIEASCHTQAEIMGKPNSYILDYIVKKDNLNKKECIMVGDSRETDIRFGNNGSIDTVCVLSGVTSEQEIMKCQKEGGFGIPMYYSKNILQ